MEEIAKGDARTARAESRMLGVVATTAVANLVVEEMLGVSGREATALAGLQCVAMAAVMAATAAGNRPHAILPGLRSLGCDLGRSDGSLCHFTTTGIPTSRDNSPPSRWASFATALQFTLVLISF